MVEDKEWIEWKGGECPVEPDTVVDYLNFGETPWSYRPDPQQARHLRWSWIWNGEAGGDIIAYRIVNRES